MEAKFKLEELSVNIKVCARFRPLNSSETEFVNSGKASKCVKFLENTVQVQDLLYPQTFTFDSLFDPDKTQEDLFNSIGKPSLNDLSEGFNSTIFAYGPTGSGKTHTMMGKLNDPVQKGIIPRIADSLCTIAKSCQMTASCLEIYRERLKDLVVQSSGSLKIKENDSGVYINGLTKVPFTNKEELINIFEAAEKLRSVAATKLNRYSSRSHFLLLIEINNSETASKKHSKLNLIDLAGSEKVMKSEVSGTTMEEAKKINLSLSSLGMVISALSTAARHVPYRNSKLTRLLQDSLGGNSKTTLIVNCSQLNYFVEETLSSLRFAQRVKLIKNTLKITKEVDLETELKSVKLELSKTQSELKRLRNQSFSDFHESEDDELIKTLELQILNNDRDIIKLESDNKELKRAVKDRKEVLDSNLLSWKLANLKSKNERFINEHLEFKCKKLEEFLKTLKLSVSEVLLDSNEDFSLCEINENNYTEKMHYLDVNSANEKDANVFYLQAEHFEKKLKKTLKILNWKLFYLYGKNKVISQACISQQTELKYLEQLIEKFRKHLRLIKEKNILNDKQGAKILESKLEIFKSQSSLWKTRIQLQSNNQKCIEKVYRELNGFSENILTDCCKENNQKSIEKISEEIAQTTDLLVSWIQACKEKQKKLGLDVAEIEELLSGITSLKG